MTTRTAALLLTDLVDSTSLAMRLGDEEMARVGAEHDHIARTLLASHGGREIDKSDGFLLLFESPLAAARYAAAYHAAIAALGLQARAGLHLGPVVLRDNDAVDVARGAKPTEVEGIAKSVAARIMSIASPGQTLASAEATRALDASGLRTIAHGHWRLKGVGDPLELFEVAEVANALPPPPPESPKGYRVVSRSGLWVPVRDIPHRLPAEHDPFVARDDDLAALARLVDEDVRLVATVVGMGGTGKTRLAVRFAWSWLGEWSGGAWFCDLVSARRAADIAATVAGALDIPLVAGDGVTQIGHALAGRGRPCLVVLDNFEQVASQAADTVGRWLEDVPDARFLVTSRESLGLPGEVVVDLAPLPRDAAIDLFVVRARGANRRFELAQESRPLVEEIVRLLDGLPLAIELAAARASMLSLHQIHDRMRDRFHLLATSRGRRAAHLTLRAAIDGSWELLSEAERKALAQLSVFRDGFTLEAAEAVLELDGTSPLEAVQGLVDKSLVRRFSEERLALLVSIQEYAAEKLATPGAFVGSGQHGVQTAELCHGRYYARTFGSSDRWRFMRSGAEARRRWAAELSNLVVACERGVRRGDATTAIETLEAADSVYGALGPYRAATDLAESVCAMALSGEDRVRAELVAGRAAYRVRERGRASSHAEAALTNVAPSTLRECGVLSLLGSLLRHDGRSDDARALFERCLALAQDLGDRDEVMSAHSELGGLDVEQGRPADARSHFEAVLLVAREVGILRAEAVALHNLAQLSMDASDWAAAHRMILRGDAICKKLGDRRGEAHAQLILGCVLVGQGDLDGCERHTRASHGTFREIGDRHGQAMALANIAEVECRRGPSKEARLLVQNAIQLMRELGERSSLADALLVQVEVLVGLGQLTAAHRSLDEAQSIAEEIGAGPDSRFAQKISVGRAQIEGSHARAHCPEATQRGDRRYW